MIRALRLWLIRLLLPAGHHVHRDPPKGRRKAKVAPTDVASDGWPKIFAAEVHPDGSGSYDPSRPIVTVATAAKAAP